MKAWLLLFWAMVASADVKVVGNGGDAVVCRGESGEISRIELYDYYEARVLRGRSITFPKGSSAEEIAVGLIRGMRERDPERHQRYLAFIASFSAQMALIEGNLTDVPDSNHAVAPPGCAVEQLVLRRLPRFPEDRLFLVSSSLWEKMSLEQRAGTILHEAFYEEALENRAVTSEVARYFHSKVAGAWSREMSDREYFELLEPIQRQFPLRWLRGMRRDVKSSLMGWLRLWKDFVFAPDGSLVALKSWDQDPLSLSPVNYESNTGQVAILATGYLDCLVSEVRFDSSPLGELLEWRNLNAQAGDKPCRGISVHGREVALKSGSSLWLHPNFVRFTLEASSCYQDEGRIFCGRELTVDAQGRVVE